MTIPQLLLAVAATIVAVLGVEFFQLRITTGLDGRNIKTVSLYPAPTVALAFLLFAIWWR